MRKILVCKKNMDLLNELGTDLALAFLVEKRHTAKIDAKEAWALIAKVKRVLQPVSLAPEIRHDKLSLKKKLTISC